MRLLRIGLVLVAILAALAAAGWLRYLRYVQAPEPELSAQVQQGLLEFDGRRRSYLYYVPTEVASNPALVIVLHGSLGDGAQARRAMAYEFDRRADENGFIVVYPDGFERHWNGCRAAGPYLANTLDVNDVGFLGALIDHFAREYGADSDRVFVTGISNGGHMALRMALEAPERVRAVAPIVASLPSGENFDCRRSGKPVALLLMNGTADPMNPHQGGTVALY